MRFNPSNKYKLRFSAISLDNSLVPGSMPPPCIANTGNAALHLTSSHFDEPKAVQMVKEHSNVISLHGYGPAGFNPSNKYKLRFSAISLDNSLVPGSMPPPCIATFR
jgi:hypothetical protein